MANYKTHSSFNLFLALPIFVVGIYYLLGPSSSYLLTFIGVFAYSTLFMSPDLDLVHNIKLKSLRGVLSLPFRFYSQVFKHRGISHSFFFGSFTRILWLGGIAFLLFFLLYQALPSQKNFLLFYNQHKLYLLYGVAGICLADWCHLLLDIKFSKILHK
ncbi:MAG: hypothetical protein K940chlam9_01636 [Chlamydiae bacterium]|nr:hypothetical protein [Chlamydiota bacterium]